MDFKSKYRSYLNSYYLSEGIRVTVGITMPAIICFYLHQENLGVTMSIGAICLMLVDSPGPVYDRLKAMMICGGIIYISSVLTALTNGNAWATGLLIACFGFLFSMIAVFGVRSGLIGLAALLVMVLNLGGRQGIPNIYLNALFTLLGGIWYMLLSISLYSFRPYKLTQQALGDCFQSTADYMELRAAFYGANPDYDEIYRSLLSKQIEINDKQNLIRELLYHSRDIVKESKDTGRVILLIFIDINDFFERMLSADVDHKSLHEHFDHTGFLEKFHKLLLQISGEMRDTAIFIQSGKPYHGHKILTQSLAKVKQEFQVLSDGKKNGSNTESFISLSVVLNALEDFIIRLQTIEQYSSYDLNNIKDDKRIQNYKSFATHKNISAKVFTDNFNWASNIFRHSLRMSIAITVGFVVSDFFPVGHAYWILLTVIVILKPAYGITNQRNLSRLLGTAAGIVAGGLIIYLVRDTHFLFLCMITLMILSYSFMRTNYSVFVVLMTSFIMILFFLLNPSSFINVVEDRVLDTAIGSVISLLANILFPPAWTFRSLGKHFNQILIANKNYFRDVASSFAGIPVEINSYKLSRKEAYIALANTSNALNQMLSEPKSKQVNIALFHQLGVLNYMMASHIATMAALAQMEKQPVQDPAYIPVIKGILANLDEAILRNSTENNNLKEPGNLEVPGVLPANQESEKFITEQFNFIWKISSDLVNLILKTKHI